MKNSVLTLAVALLAAPHVLADAAPMLPLTNWSQPTYRIETQEVHSEYVFVLCREGSQFHATKGWGEFQNLQYVEITPESPLLIDLASWSGQEPDARRKEQAKLIAVPRELAGPDKTATEFDKTQDRPGKVLGFFNRESASPTWADKHVTVTYRIQRKRAGDGLEIVRTSWSPLWQWYVMVLSFGACVVFGGLWIVRRVFRPRQAHCVNPPAARSRLVG